MSASGSFDTVITGMQTGTPPPENYVEVGPMDPDQVKRAQRMMAACPGLFVSTPSQNGSNHYQADFAVGEDGSVCVHHAKLQYLLDELESAYGFGE